MPNPYVKTTWVDEDGSGNGTAITAARMNNIEVGVYDATVAANAAAGSSALIDGGTPSTNHAGNLKLDFGGVS